MKKYNILLLEAIVVGILLIIFVYVSSYLLKVAGYPMVETPFSCKKWNDTYIMEATLFLAGVMFHLTFECLGLNKMYVDNYYLYAEKS